MCIGPGSFKFHGYSSGLAIPVRLLSSRRRWLSTQATQYARVTVRPSMPAMKFITKLDHPPYSPDLAPCDFRLIPKLKNSLKGQSFADIPDIQRNVTRLLRGIPENDFQDCFRQWHHRLTKCIASQGEYFEGDSRRLCKGKQVLLSQGHSGN
jgi:hypothetical protein